MAKPAKRQHYLARFHLRNFADPLFSDNLRCYDLKTHRWEHRTTHGVGWFRHLLTMIDESGNRTDAFDQFLKLNVEDPAAPALRKMATGDPVTQDERSAIAMFIALTAARSPAMTQQTMTSYLEQLSETERGEVNSLTRIWCGMIRRQLSDSAVTEFYKPSSLRAIWLWAKSFQHRLLQWQWHLINTVEDQPFVCSDRPVFAEWDQGQDIRFVSFPVSSIVALIVFSDGQLRQGLDDQENVRVSNRLTMAQATDFVVACRQAFPGDEFLER